MCKVNLWTAKTDSWPLYIDQWSPKNELVVALIRSGDTYKCC